MAAGFTSVVLVNVVIAIFVIQNHFEDIRAVFGPKKYREKWINEAKLDIQIHKERNPELLPYIEHDEKKSDFIRQQTLERDKRMFSRKEIRLVNYKKKTNPEIKKKD